MSTSSYTAKLNNPLSEAEFIELDRFLASKATGDTTMMVDTLDGFLTAVVLGPVDIPMVQWLPRVWGSDSKATPSFKNKEQADRILGLIVRQMNGVIRSLELDLDNFKPVLDVTKIDEQEFDDGEMWAYGFMAGINLAREAWKPLFEEPTALQSLMPIYLLGEKNLKPEQQALVATPQQRAELASQLPATVATLYRFWTPYREAADQAEVPSKTVQYAEPKTGRNDPCPCGSGKKYKKCCGAEA
ncbi:MAG TPA: UPF0149 family protein [Rhodocyclaceae bacterium]|jgi:uncharacterized protein|nr:UPF0149 family protein [Rhodocyclaceae bacterium]